MTKVKEGAHTSLQLPRRGLGLALGSRVSRARSQTLRSQIMVTAALPGPERGHHGTFRKPEHEGIKASD